MATNELYHIWPFSLWNALRFSFYYFYCEDTWYGRRLNDLILFEDNVYISIINIEKRTKEIELNKMTHKIV